VSRFRCGQCSPPVFPTCDRVKWPDGYGAEGVLSERRHLSILGRRSRRNHKWAISCFKKIRF
jgi:hypothetical protein